MALNHRSPNARLARELEQVAREAEAVTFTLRGVNLMPRGFPSEAVNEICIALVNLRDGTAEGCHEPLNFARYLLPLIRRDHFHIDGEAPELDDEDDTYFSREHPLDLAITRLYAAVGTALDEYRAQAQDLYDDYVGPEEMLELRDDGTFASIDQKSRKVVQSADREHQALIEIADASSETAAELARQIQDGSNIAHAVQAQIRIRPIVARWIKSADAALRRLPDVITSTAETIRIGTDIAKIWVEEWSALNKRIRVLAYDSLYGLADALRSTGERLKQQSGARKDTIERQRDPEVVAAEKLVKSMLLAGEELPRDLAKRPEVLLFHASDGKIKRPLDLARLENLRWLSLGDSGIFSEVAGVLPLIPKLADLQINLISEADISPIAAVRNLKSLIVYANVASDISGISQIGGLTRLTLNASSAKDISALGKLSELINLVLFAHSATEVASLGNLSKLERLTLHAENARDFSALGRLSNLTSLTLHLRNVDDWSFIGKLPRLTKLALSAPRIDLTEVRNLEALTELSIHGPRSLDLAQLAGLKKLRKLKLTNVQFRNLSQLKGVEVELRQGSVEIS